MALEVLQDLNRANKLFLHKNKIKTIFNKGYISPPVPLKLNNVHTIMHKALRLITHSLHIILLFLF